MNVDSKISHWTPSLALFAVCAVVLFPSVNDFPVTDCFSLIAKANSLSFVQIFSPDQTAEINPYYRPLIVAVLKVFESLDGPATELQHLFAITIHALGAVFLYRIGYRLTERRLYSLTAALLYAISPASASTVAWTTVCYAVLSGAFSLGVVWSGLALIQTAKVRYVFFALALQLVGLLASQTAYQCAPLWILLGVCLGLKDRRTIRLWVIGTAGIAALTAAFYVFLESHLNASTFGQGDSSVFDFLTQTALNLPTYFGRFFGIAHVTWVAFYPAFFGAAVLSIRWIGWRKTSFLSGWLVVSTFPYALIAEGTDRYAYFSGAPTYLWLLVAIDGLHERVAKTRLITAVALVAFGAFLCRLTHIELQAWDRLGRDSRLSYESIMGARSRYTTPERLHLVNTPSFHRWLLAYVYEISSDDLRVTVKHYRNFETDRVRFGPRDLKYRDGDLMFWYDEDFLKEARPDDLPEKDVYPLVGFPSQSVVVDNGLSAVCQAIDRFDGNPLDLVVLENKGIHLPEPSQVGRVLETDPKNARLSVHMPEDGLIVIQIPFWPLDPLAHHVGQTSRIYSSYRVLLDGNPINPMPAFYHFVAFQVPKGDHAIQLIRRG